MAFDTAQRMTTRRSNVKKNYRHRSTSNRAHSTLNSEKRRDTRDFFFSFFFLFFFYPASTRGQHTAPSPIPAPHCSTSTHCNCHGLWNLQSRRGKSIEVSRIRMSRDSALYYTYILENKLRKNIIKEYIVERYRAIVLQLYAIDKSMSAS